MHVIRRRGWEIPECLATPEHLVLNRRALLAATGVAALSLAPKIALAQRVSDLPDPTKDLYPVGRNEKYTLDRPVTDEKINISYNNFYEFGSSKSVAKAAQALKLRPWTVKIDGMVETPQELGIDDLIRKMPLEERLTAIVASRRGRWPFRGAASPSPSWWNWPSPCRRPNTCAWRLSSIRRPRPARSRAGIPGPMSRA
jgi:DMSO/TMAO reductase YedYZ molybdopterin-dependent catalytic subunit